jgi:hypothetical protein
METKKEEKERIKKFKEDRKKQEKEKLINEGFSIYIGQNMALNEKLYEIIWNGRGNYRC